MVKKDKSTKSNTANIDRSGKKALLSRVPAYVEKLRQFKKEKFTTISEKNTEISKHGEAAKNDDEYNYFKTAMLGVAPLKKQKNIISKQPNPNIYPHHKAFSDDIEAIIQLTELIDGKGFFDITMTDEYIEGHCQGLDKKVMKTLKQGKLPLQGNIDLHGSNCEEAAFKVKNFISDSISRGFRCVMVVHGKGNNSENKTPVLKEQLHKWLSQGFLRKKVLAFCSAKQYDGGTGATYILLRRR